MVQSDAPALEWVANSVAPMPHLNYWQTDVSTLPAPFTSSENLYFKQLVAPGTLFSPEDYPDLAWTPMAQERVMFSQPLEFPYGFQVFTLFDEEGTLKSRSGGSWFNFDILPSGGVYEAEANVTADYVISYNVVDREGNFYIGVRHTVKKLNPDLSESASWKVSESDEQVFSVTIAPSGDVCVLLGTPFGAKIVFLDKELSVLAKMDFAEEFGIHQNFTISNSPAFDMENGFDYVYVPVREYLVKVKWNRDIKELSIIWNATIGGWSDVTGIGRVGWGIGSAPSITEDSGEKYVVLTDGNIPYGLHYVKCSDGTSASITVTFGVDRKTSTEQSTVVSGLRAVVVNNYFADKKLPDAFSFCELDPKMNVACRANLLHSYGVAAFDFDPKTSTISKAWERTDISCSTSIPVVSSANYYPQVLYCIGTIPSNNISVAHGVGMTTLEAMNWETGESFFQYELGRSPWLGATYAATTIHESGIFYGGGGGIVHIYNSSTVQDDTITCTDHIETSSTCNTGGICTCDELLTSYTCDGSLDIAGLPYTPVNKLCGESCQVCLGNPIWGLCPGLLNGDQCNGVFLPNSECSCVAGISGKLCSGDESDNHILTSGREIPFDTCIYDGLYYRKAQCTDDDDFVALFTYSDPFCSYEYANEPPVSLRKNKCYDFYDKDVIISFHSNSTQRECVSLANIEEKKVPTLEPTTQCIDIAEYTDVCRYSSTMCTCHELLASTTCKVPYTADKWFSRNEGICDLKRLQYDIREAAAGSEALASSCETVLSHFEDNGSWPEDYLCDCFGGIPEDIASVIFNCQVSGSHLIYVWSSCVIEDFSLLRRTITTDPIEACPASCGLCVSAAPTSDPTKEATECVDIAMYSDVCRYSLTMCTCSELLESTTCDVPYTAVKNFSLNEGSCNFKLLVKDIREASVSSGALASCETVLIFFEENRRWPENFCSCLRHIPQEAASSILNCKLGNSNLVRAWGFCNEEGFSLYQRTIITDPNELCPVSCGLCGTPVPVYEPTAETIVPTVEPTECTDVAEYSEMCRYSATMCTCSEVLESTSCGMPYTAIETFSTNEGSCDFELLWYDIRKAAAISEVLATNCEDVISHFQNKRSWPDPDVCLCFAHIPDEIASVIFNCYVNDNHLIDVRDLCLPGSFSLIQRTITTDPNEICPASCGLCRDPTPEPTAEPTWKEIVPTVEPTECSDVAEYSEVCRYSLTMCTCSEVLESTTCDVPYTANATFFTNDGSCDFDLLWYDIREAAVSELLAKKM